MLTYEHINMLQKQTLSTWHAHYQVDIEQSDKSL